jgi:hypothetical protein
MKFLFFFALPMMLAGCANRHEPTVRVAAASVPGTTLTSADVENVRYAENIKAYSLGRYIDPSNSRIMHEGHTIYSVETTAKWNLHPNISASVPLGPVRVRDSAKATSPVGDELLAEVNQQREATKAVMQGGVMVTQKLGDLADQLKQTQQIATQNAQLKRQADAAQRRLDAIEEQLHAEQSRTSPTQKVDEPEKSNW